MTIYINGCPARVSVEATDTTDTLILKDGSGEVDRVTVPAQFFADRPGCRFNNSGSALDLVHKHYGKLYTVTWLGRGFEVNFV